MSARARDRSSCWCLVSVACLRLRCTFHMLVCAYVVLLCAYTSCHPSLSSCFFFKWFLVILLEIVVSMLLLLLLLPRRGSRQHCKCWAPPQNGCATEISTQRALPSTCELFLFVDARSTYRVLSQHMILRRLAPFALLVFVLVLFVRVLLFLLRLVLLLLLLVLRLFVLVVSLFPPVFLEIDGGQKREGEKIVKHFFLRNIWNRHNERPVGFVSNKSRNCAPSFSEEMSGQWSND